MREDCINLQDDTPDFWWLAALEASLSFSLICSESVAPRAAPLTHPLRFSIVVMIIATLAMGAYHVGPALFAVRLSWSRASSPSR